MNAHFVKVNPSGNTTALILDPFPREIYPRIASLVMKSTSLAAEQVGFVERTTLPGVSARLQMMGGEFCGNACRALSAWLVEQRSPGTLGGPESKEWRVPIEVSGYKGTLNTVVKREQRQSQTYTVLASMPLPLWMLERPMKSGAHPFTLVGFEGIVHAVVWNEPPLEDQFNLIKREVLDELKEVDCLGVIFYDEKTQFLTPIVYVPKTDSLVRESSCGSGSVAVASALAARDKKNIESLRLFQPGGVLDVSVKWEGNVLEAQISGEVIIEAQGTVYLNL